MKIAQWRGDNAKNQYRNLEERLPCYQCCSTVIQNSLPCIEGWAPMCLDTSCKNTIWRTLRQIEFTYLLAHAAMAF